MQPFRAVFVKKEAGALPPAPQAAGHSASTNRLRDLSKRVSTESKESGMAAATEQQLIAQARQGSHEAYRLLVERHIREAYDLAVGFVRDHDDAEDVVQEAFVRAYNSLPGFRGDSRFGTWLYRIVVNLSLNRVKQEKTRAERELPMFSASALVGRNDGRYDDADVRGHIERALHELPTLQRAVVILRHIEGLSTREVSRILRCSEGTVKTHLFRGLEKMREKLEFLKEEGV
jgi:RNA polymerase sigma-70 factor (ECF subfamily)